MAVFNKTPAFTNGIHFDSNPRIYYNKQQRTQLTVQNKSRGESTMKKRVVCFGDSNTWGYIAGLGQRYDESIRWPARLQEKLGSDYLVVEEGLTGRTTVFDDPFDPFMNGLKFMPAVLRTAAPIDLLVFMLGTNDFQSHIPEGNPISTARGVQLMLEEARKLDLDRPGGEKMKILMISPIEISEARLTFKKNDVTDQQSIDNSRKLGEHMKIVAEELGVEFIDAAKYIKPGPVDGVHLNEEGHAKMAELVYAKVKEMLP